MIAIYKPRGTTPLNAINRLREKYPKYSHTILSYAGRLDPMAEGVLPILIGKENKFRQKYLSFDKTYYFEVLLGVSTDTNDVLGVVENDLLSTKTSSIKVAENQIEAVIKKMVGKQAQPYPAFSSKTVNGKPLWQWAREGKLSQIKAPSRTIEIFSLSLLSISNIQVKNYYKKTIQEIDKLKGDFRQKQVIKSWKEWSNTTQLNTLPILHLRAKCTTGTYVRSLSRSIGQSLEIDSLACRIVREQVGSITTQDCITI